MEELYQTYRNASRQVRSGWARRAWTGPRGETCLMQSVINELQVDRATVPPEVIREIDAAIARMHPTYRFNPSRLFGGDRLMLITRWNDSAMRAKTDVIGVLDALADDHEAEWLRQERVRLTGLVGELQAQVAGLTAKLEHAEAENRHLLGRLISYVTLKSDRDQLERLEADLERRWDELKQLPDHASTT